ncbi:MAG: class II fructose-bisphosphate aldolase [Planctomycetales bacterium]|nr:class II fructose-bisphosphate aldolase [Planctomycetales bacterium]
MASWTTTSELRAGLRAAATIGKNGITITDPKAFREKVCDPLTETAVFAEDAAVRGAARWAIRAAAPKFGVVTSSIHALYAGVGRGQAGGFTVPAVNVRGLSYDTARAVVRAAKALDSGAFIFEIARSEIGYTHQRPGEYASVVTAAAIREGHEGPLFLQGDHFQANAKKYATDPAAETQALRDLIAEALEADFRNIDIDTSTLVDLSKATLAEQQRVNCELCAELTAAIREKQPKGVTVSVGGEIGEVGKKNSTVEELRAFLDGYRKALAARAPGAPGISKVSVQTGTSHGGIPLPDGTVAKVKLDFAALEALSKCARSEYGLGGAVQHGASTLPEELFDKFPQTGTLEIHLATEFQNIVLDHPSFPGDLRSEIFAYIREQLGNERSEGETDEQFLYKTRKKAWGPFKRQVWGIAPDARKAIGRTLEEKFTKLFRKLGAAGTRGVVRELVPLVPPTVPPVPDALL